MQDHKKRTFLFLFEYSWLKIVYGWTNRGMTSALKFVVTFMSNLHCFIIVLKIYDDTLMEMVSHANRTFFILL